jgi:hypothetical protein
MYLPVFQHQMSDVAWEKAFLTFVYKKKKKIFVKKKYFHSPITEVLSGYLRLILDY